MQLPPFQTKLCPSHLLPLSRPFPSSLPMVSATSISETFAFAHHVLFSTARCRQPPRPAKNQKKICPQKKQGGKRNDNGRRRQTPDARKMPAPPPPTLSPPSPPPPDHATAVARAKTHGARQPTAKACVFRTWHLRAPCIGSLLGGLSRSLAAFFPGRVLVFWWWWWFPSTYEARVE